MNSHSSVYSRYQETCEASSISDPHKQAIWEAIYSHHTEGTRFYHTLSHLMCMFDFIKRACKAGYTLQDPAALDWSVWLHDIIYNPTSPSNEADSAALAAQLLLPAGVPEATVARIQQYILATADHHHLEGEPDGDLLMDADLSILAAPLQRYTEYAVAIRSEYGHLSDEEFTQGRARVLKGLLDREQLFLTDIGKSTCEAAARANMAHEWRLVFGGQLLQANTLDETEVEGTEEEQPAAAAAAASSTATAEVDAAADSKRCGCL